MAEVREERELFSSCYSGASESSSYASNSSCLFTQFNKSTSPCNSFNSNGVGIADWGVVGISVFF